MTFARSLVVAPRWACSAQFRQVNPKLRVDFLLLSHPPLFNHGNALKFVAF